MTRGCPVTCRPVADVRRAPRRADLPVSLASIAEASRRSNRGAVIGLSNLLWSVGILASTGIAAIVGGLGRIGGQVLFGHLVVVAVIVLLLRLTVPESRSWETAHDARRRSTPTSPEHRGSVRDLMKGPYLTAFVALMVFYTLTNLAANTAGQFNPLVAVNLADVPVEVFSRVSLVGLLIGVASNLVFMKVVDGRLRLPFFIVGAILLIAGYAAPAVLGFSLVSMAALVVLTQIGSAFAFEGIMKVWTQETFPTLLRASAQGAIVAVARVSAALLALVTPVLLDWNARLAYLVIAGLLAIGLVVGWLRFRRSDSSSFDEEDAKDDAATAAAAR